jgi:TolB protein
MMKRSLLAIVLLLVSTFPVFAQTDWIRTGTGLGVERVRLAAADFKVTGTADPRATSLDKVFNDTLWNDLDQAGIFDMVSKSFYPLAQPGYPQEMNLGAWSNPPPNAAMVAFGNLNIAGDQVNVLGWLYDVRNTASPLVLGKQYKEAATEDMARTIAHRFADEIIYRLGGGVNGIAESKVAFISNRGGHKEVWMMDYDGANQHQITKLRSIALSPRLSPDGSRIAFVSFVTGNADLAMYSLDLGRLVAFPHYGGMNVSPAWSSDGTRLAFSSSMRGSSEIYVADVTGAGPRRLTDAGGSNVSPAWNPKTNAQIAFVSNRAGHLPQLFVMDADGANVTRLTDGGYAVSPSWSPNGQFLTFAWDRKYGPGAPGHQDIYVMDLTTHQWVQLTHDAGTNDFPSWSPDGRHIVFQSSRTGTDQIWTMLADGTQQRQLTHDGTNTQPNWSWK